MLPQVGLGICYDLRFPELSLALQRDGAQILTYPSAFTVATGAAHWEVGFTESHEDNKLIIRARQRYRRKQTQIQCIYFQVLLRARAIETQCFVLAAAQVGRHHEKRASHGHALVVDPWGEVLGDCGGEKPGLVLVGMDLEKVSSTRRNMPVQEHRRDTGFYHSLEKT